MSQKENQPENTQNQVNPETEQENTANEVTEQQQDENGQASTDGVEANLVDNEHNKSESATPAAKATGWKVATGVLAAAVIGLAIYTFMPGNSDSTIAKVNGAKISQSDVFNQIVKFNHDYVSEIVNASIDQKVIDQELKAKNITVTDADLDAELTAFRLKYPNDSDFQSLLSYYGMTEADLKENLKQSSQIRLLLQDTVTISDDQIQSYFDENKANLGAHGKRVSASHILVPDEDTAKDIIAQLDKGADFATLAAQYGTDGTAQTGGDLGFFEAGDMVAEFSDAAFALALDTYTKEPVKSSFGYHVILKTGEEDAYEPTVDNLKDAIKTELINTKIYETNPTFLDDLRSKANVTNSFDTLFPGAATATDAATAQ